MPSFGDPFAANVERKMTKKELAQAIRLDLAGELEAIYLYDAHAQATDDPVAKKVLEDIRDEEKAHMGELTTLLRYLDPVEVLRKFTKCWKSSVLNRAAVKPRQQKARQSAA